MSSIETHLTNIEAEIAVGHAETPEVMLIDLMRQMGLNELADWRPDILRLIDKFQKKRRANLLAVLEAQFLYDSVPEDRAHENRSIDSIRISRAELESEFRNDLSGLSERHIFQWSTFYRDCLAKHLEKFLNAIKTQPSSDMGESLSDIFSDHAHEIFTKGYGYVADRMAHTEAIQKSLGGLARFLELPIDFYSARASSARDYASASALRILVSACVAGILKGYCSVKMNKDKGTDLLPRYPRTWVHYLGFMTPEYAKVVIDSIASGQLRAGLSQSVLPLLDALSLFFEREGEDYFPLPLVGQFSWESRRLDIALRPPPSSQSPRLVEAHAYLDESFVSIYQLREATARQVAVVLTPLKPDIDEVIQENIELNQIVVRASESDRRTIASEVFKILDDSLYARRSKRAEAFPISYNIAREFPLRNPSRAKFYHVHRTSVRDLLRTFERRNGVRLWCSVRRSGKSTACFDLGSTTGNSLIISQTCDSTEQSQNAHLFYDHVNDAINNGRQLSNDFVDHAITSCAPMGSDESSRMVFVLDEYETLFGRLRGAVRRDPDIRYTVVQPLLNQLVAFSQNNLLVFLGQQPDAHFILMDQNQLAAYVEQDPFPLFEHIKATTTGEFSELVSKILAERIDFDAGFVDALYTETAGHPFLTANVLSELVDWLIQEKRPARGLRLRRQDFEGFIPQMLVEDRIALSPDYDLFRAAASEAMSTDGYHTNQWLYAVYWVLRELTIGDPDRLAIQRSQFSEMLSHIPAPGPLPQANDILRTASQANFLAYDDEYVRVRIKILGRIAASTRPKIG